MSVCMYPILDAVSDDNASFKASTAHRKGLTIKIVRRMKHTFPRAIALMAAGFIDFDALVSRCCTLAEGAAAFQVAAAREGLKDVIKP
jgi:L-iditol 2-dehydrogenase